MSKKQANKKSEIVNVTVNPERVEHASALVESVIYGLSNLFNMSVTYEDREGKTTTTNRMRFTLVSAYNGLAYSLSRQEEWLNSQLDQARDKAKAALFAANGTEISILNVQRAADRLDQIEEELAACVMLKDRCIAVHDEVSGKKFEYRGAPVTTKSQRVDTKNTDVQRLAKRINVSLDSLPNTNGVN
jgi:hypothetical protein